MPVLVIALLLAVGVGLLVLGLIGRRLDDHPVCRRCRFDLVGVYEPGGTQADPARCPECGSHLSSRGVRCGNRRRRRGAVIAGLLLMLVSLGAGSVIGWGAASGFDWNSVKPAWLLQMDANSGDPAVARAALEELHARLDDGVLTDGRIRSLASAGLDCQADLDRAWDPLWGDLVEKARKGDLVDDEEWARYFVQCLPEESFTVRMRERVRVGDPIPYRLSIGSPRLGQRDWYWLSLRTARVGWAGETREHNAGFGGVGIRNGANGRDGGPAADFRLDLPVGTHEVFVEMQFRPSPEQMVFLDGAERVVRFEQTVQVVPADAQTVEIVSDQQLADEVRGSLEIEYLAVTPQGDGTFIVNGMIAFENPPVGMAFDVVWIADGVEIFAGRTAIAVGQGGNGRFGSERLNDFEAKTVDVILRPSVDAAMETVDVERIWGEELRFEGIPVRWPER